LLTRARPAGPFAAQPSQTRLVVGHSRPRAAPSNHLIPLRHGPRPTAGSVALTPVDEEHLYSTGQHPRFLLTLLLPVESTCLALAGSDHGIYCPILRRPRKDLLIFFCSNFAAQIGRCLVNIRRRHMSTLPLCDGTANSPCWSECSGSRLAAARRVGREAAVSCRWEKPGTLCLLRAKSPSLRRHSRFVCVTETVSSIMWM
jgi:hypothetical protein